MDWYVAIDIYKIAIYMTKYMYKTKQDMNAGIACMAMQLLE